MSSEFAVIGKPTAMVDAAEKTTGSGKYTDDLSVSGMLVGKILHSPYPHARIKSIDTSEAAKLDGVVAVAAVKEQIGKGEFVLKGFGWKWDSYAPPAKSEQNGSEPESGD